MSTIKLKPLLISIIIPILVGIIGSFLGGSMEGFERLNKPNFMPSNIVFPIVWTILYILMGISAYLIYTSKSEKKKKALIWYGISLFINMLWPLLFFRFLLLYLSFWWIILLIAVVIIMLTKFYKIKPLAGYLQLPYLIWLLFAAVLNYSIYLLN